MSWAKAGYNTGRVSSDMILTPLSFITNRGRYHIFKGHNKYYVIFNDQKELLNYVSSNPNGLFIIRGIVEGDPIKVYRDKESGNELHTVAWAKVVVDGERPINLVVSEDLEVIISKGE